MSSNLDSLLNTYAATETASTAKSKTGGKKASAQQKTPEEPKAEVDEEVHTETAVEDENLQYFTEALAHYKEERPEKRLACQLDAVLLDTISKIRLPGNPSRAMIVNCIVRAFLLQHKDQLSEYITTKPTLY